MNKEFKSLLMLLSAFILILFSSYLDFIGQSELGILIIFLTVVYIIVTDNMYSWLTNNIVETITEQPVIKRRTATFTGDIDFSDIEELLRKDVSSSSAYKGVPEKLFSKSIIKQPNQKFINNVVNVITNTLLKKNINVSFKNHTVSGNLLTVYFVGVDVVLENGSINNFDVNKISKALDNIKSELGDETVLFNPFTGTAGVFSFTVNAQTENTLSLGNYYNEFGGDGLSVILGQKLNGETLKVDLIKMIHFMLVASTGAGKSSLLRVILAQLLSTKTPEQLELWLSDNKRTELTVLEKLPHTKAFADTYDGTIEICEKLVEEMDRRNKVLVDAEVADLAAYNKKSKNKMPYIFLLIEEWPGLVAFDKKGDLQNLLMLLLSKARSSGIIIGLVSQIALATVIKTELKSNFPTKIIMKLANNKANSVVDAQDAHLLGVGQGQLIGGSTIETFQSPFCSADELKAVVKHITM